VRQAWRWRRRPGLWINVIGLFVLALRRGLTKPDPRLPGLIMIVLAGSVIAGVVARVLVPVLIMALAGFPAERLATLAAIGLLAGTIYIVIVAGGLKAAGLLRLLR
jgi:putative peptidoglycan lipid II flippase